MRIDHEEFRAFLVRLTVLLGLVAAGYVVLLACGVR